MGNLFSDDSNENEDNNYEDENVREGKAEVKKSIRKGGKSITRRQRGSNPPQTKPHTKSGKTRGPYKRKVKPLHEEEEEEE